MKALFLACVLALLAPAAAFAECSGDLAGSQAGCTVIGIQKVPVSPQAPATGQALLYGLVGQWEATTLALSVETSWTTGEDLVTAATPFANFSVARTITSIICTPEALVGGTATIDVYVAPSGTALGAGTKIDTTACNANSTAATDQSMFSGSVAVPAGDRVGLVATGGGWASSVGSGVITVTFK
jgi:hypothetical protein